MTELWCETCPGSAPAVWQMVRWLIKLHRGTIHRESSTLGGAEVRAPLKMME